MDLGAELLLGEKLISRPALVRLVRVNETPSSQLTTVYVSIVNKEMQFHQLHDSYESLGFFYLFIYF